MCPQFVASPELRAQYDIDLLLKREDVLAGRDAIGVIGYEPLQGFDRFPLDHLPAMIRKTGWEWRGDYFDPEIPLSIELHFRLWDEHTEGFAVDTSAFWERREQREVDGVSITALQPADALAYVCLHLLRHLLRGDLRPSHVYELAWFLHGNAENAVFLGRLARRFTTLLCAACRRSALRWRIGGLPATSRRRFGTRSPASRSP